MLQTIQHALKVTRRTAGRRALILKYLIKIVFSFCFSYEKHLAFSTFMYKF